MDNKRLTLLEIGRQDCSDMHSWGGVRNIYVLHYIERGKGTLKAGGRVYGLQQGQVFLVKKGELTEYRPSKEEPYTYKWVGFDGSMAQELLASTGLLRHPVTPEMPQIEVLFDLARKKGQPFTFCSSHLLQIFATLIEAYPNKKDDLPHWDSAQIAHDYILARLHQSDLRVQKAADIANVSRSCLFRAFRQRYGMSPMQFIESERMKNARRLLKEGYSVKLVAESCGYDDALYFSACFKRIHGMSPLKYRQQKTASDN